MEEKVVVQKIRKSFERKVDIAIKYYSIISMLNNLELTEREIQLMAHTATRGTISTIASKNEFIKLFPGSSVATINNIISALKKRKLLVKDEKMIRVNPGLIIPFAKADTFVFNIICTLPKE